MGRARGGDAAKAAFWQGMIDRQRTSGLSIRQFCRRQRLSEPRFYWWRRRLAERRPQPSPRLQPSGRRSTASLSHRAENMRRIRAIPFVPVQVLAASAIEIVLDEGVCIRVPPGAARDQLREVLAALDALSPRSENAC